IRYWVTMSVHSLRPAALRWLGGFGRVLPGKVVSSIGISSNFRRFGPIAGVICQLAGHYPKARGNSPLQPLYIYSFLTQLGRTRARPRGIGRKNSYPPPPGPFSPSIGGKILSGRTKDQNIARLHSSKAFISEPWRQSVFIPPSPFARAMRRR